MVLDTNDLLHYMRFDKIPWKRLFGPGTSVMIPHVVIDEIDEIDEIDRKSYDTNDTGVRKRARGVFALLEQTPARIEVDAQAMASGDTIVNVLLDEPGHVRLPNNDAEIVARACHLQQAIAPIPVTVVTGDNGMRARRAVLGTEGPRPGREVQDRTAECPGEGGKLAGHHLRGTRRRGVDRPTRARQLVDQERSWAAIS
ncbi:PIN domain-containing protein [Streptomyces sp. NPDC048415]|uniref:PIN domain-containing protein n=1 Tax=Streptomyces sp. NPDC048415 TaxID=3154822 RepID=UPI0034291514